MGLGNGLRADEPGASANHAENASYLLEGSTGATRASMLDCFIVHSASLPGQNESIALPN
jgi:hypothetical protein